MATYWTFLGEHPNAQPILFTYHNVAVDLFLSAEKKTMKSLISNSTYSQDMIYLDSLRRYRKTCLCMVFL
jgi:hypothetical protein